MEYTPALMYVCKKGGFIVDMMPLFSYRTGNSVIHKLPPTLKIILLPLFSAMLFLLPPISCLFYCLGTALIARTAGISFSKQLKDLKFLLSYVLLLLCTYVFSVLSGEKSDPKPFFLLVLRLAGAIQMASVFFNTTTSFQLKRGLETILPKKVCTAFVLFLFFIPVLFSIWSKLENAWKARGGKNTPAKFFKLFPLLVSCGFYKAQQSAYALQNRYGINGT